MRNYAKVASEEENVGEVEVWSDLLDWAVNPWPLPISVILPSTIIFLPQNLGSTGSAKHGDVRYCT